MWLSYLQVDKSAQTMRKRNGSDWVVVRVRYRKTLAVGMQWGSIIVVAREMLVEKPKPKAKKKVA